MAMLDIFYPEEGQVRKEFEAAAVAGNRIFLSTERIISDVMVITIFPATSAVKNEEDIVPLLESFNKGGEYSKVILTDVMDLTRAFDDQVSGSVRKETILSAKVRADLEDLDRRLILRQAQNDWAYLPFYQKWFTRFPEGQHNLG